MAIARARPLPSRGTVRVSGRVRAMRGSPVRPVYQAVPLRAPGKNPAMSDVAGAQDRPGANQGGEQDADCAE